MSEPQLFTVPPQLTERQQIVYQFSNTPIDAREAGRLLHFHAQCQYCKPVNVCQYAEAHGREVLEALKRKGLLKRDRHHVYRRTDQPTTQSNELPPDY